ncbi:MAG: (2Fe-2S)-binding protein [Oligoflexales bacterium]|nr:(2Fe-2S)-binding protein [Oligoflexales bacterium]
MFVCLCNAVSDKQIKKAISDGASSVEEVQQVSNAGKNCGTCIYAVQEIIDREVGDKKENSKPEPKLGSSVKEL